MFLTVSLNTDEALSLLSHLSNLNTPTDRSLNPIYRWLDSHREVRNVVAKNFLSTNRSKNENRHFYADLMALHTPAEDNWLSAGLAKYLGICFVVRIPVTTFGYVID